MFSNRMEGDAPDWVVSLDASVWRRLERDGFDLESGIRALRTVDHTTFALDYLRLEAERLFRPHRHANLHLLRVHKGSGFYYQDGRVAHLSRGSVVTVDAGAIHCLGAGSTQLLVSVLSFPKSSLVAEQRGEEITSLEASTLREGVWCCGNEGCGYVGRTVAAMNLLVEGP